MANQMIALGARAPQMDILGPSIQRNAQMINMMRQQDAAERQAVAAAQEAKIAAAQELRAAAKEGRDAQEAKIKLLSDAGKIFRDSLASWVPFGDAAAAQRLRDLAVDLVPELKDVLPTAEKLATDRNLYNQSYMTAEQLANKRFGTATTSTQVDPRTNKIMAVNAAGLPEASFAQPVPDISQPLANGGAPVTPTAGAKLRPTRGVNTTPRDLEGQMAPAAPMMVTPERLEAAARAAARGARATDPIFDGLTEDQFRQMQVRADEIRAESGGASLKPASFGEASKPDLGAIVDNMMQTGVVSQTDFEAMRAAAPGKDQQLAQILRDNNIRIMADEQSAGGLRSAVYRPEDGGAMMQEVQYNPNAYETAQGKNPMVSPSAPSKSPEQIYREERAREQAKADAARNAGPKPLTAPQEAKLRDNIAKDYKAAQSTIDMMLNPVSGVVAAIDGVRKLTDAQKEAVTGFSAKIPSVTASSRNADTKLNNLKGKATEMGKAAASLTGAIGQMAVQEWRIVRDMIASLDLEGMEPSDLNDQLDIIEAQARRAAAITQDAYENQYVEEFARYPGRFQLKTPGAPAPRAQSNEARIPRIRNDADYSRLKPGTLFIDPNGQTRRKP
jgi:hypothetical protein